MKIAVISHSAVVPLYREKFHLLAQQGLEVHLILPAGWPEGSRWISAPAPGLEAGITVHVLPGLGLGRVGGFYLKGLAGLLRRLKPDLIHVEEEPYGVACWQAMQAARRLGCPWLFFTWENILRPYRWPMAAIDRQVMKKCQWAIAGNQEARDILMQRGHRGTRVVIPQYGVNPEVFKKQDQSRPTAGMPLRLAYCGRLLKEKGIETLLQAAAKLQGEWQLTIRGNGPHAMALRALVRDLDLDSRVNFEEAVSNSAMPQVLNQIDVLVLPSLTTTHWKEQFGRILIEAMSCEVAVIGSYCGEIPHVIGEAGRLFPEGNVQVLHDQLKALREDSALRENLGRLARQRVEAHFTTARIVEATVALYQKMMAGQNP